MTPAGICYILAPLVLLLFKVHRHPGCGSRQDAYTEDAEPEWQGIFSVLMSGRETLADDME